MVGSSSRITKIRVVVREKQKNYFSLCPLWLKNGGSVETSLLDIERKTHIFEKRGGYNEDDNWRTMDRQE